MSSRIIALVAVVFLLASPLTAWSQNVSFGYDAYDRLGCSFWDFGSIPIPADFFGPGSDPFVGQIQLQGLQVLPTQACPTGPNNIDTIIQRTQDALLPFVGSSDVVPVELVELSLTSCQPITVTYTGGMNPEQWTVDMTLSPTVSTGTMNFTKTHASGGTFDINVTINPRFTFTRVFDSAQVILDDPVNFNDQLSAANVPWVYNIPEFACPSCESNIVPANDGTQNVPFTLNGTHSNNDLEGGCRPVVIPTLSTWGLILLSALLVIASVFFLARRRRVLAGA